MSNSLHIEIFNGEQGKFYKMNDIKFHIRFPLDYALNLDPEQKGCGPEKCGNCLFYGSIRGVFVGYCQNCISKFQNTRGNSCRVNAGYKYLSQEEFEQCLPYMKDIKLEDIGDEKEEEQEEETEEQETEEQKYYAQHTLFDDDDDWNSYDCDDYYEPDEYGISEYERSQIPYDLRALDPRYQAQLADFRDYAR